ncbi:MAG: hypothetical protein R8J94_08825 [Acidimicrobiia bacterium]|nr:hypothetical protein [Acidimicrobiia bacterium]
MTTLHTNQALKRLVLAVAATVMFAACTSDGAPDSLPFVDDLDGDSNESSDIAGADEETTLESLLDIDSLNETVTGPTTTAVPPPEPVEPTLEVECATNPRTVTLTFADDADVPLEWELAVRRQPGGTDLETVVEQLASGSEVPSEPIVHDVNTNDLEFAVSVVNSSGAVDVAVKVHRYTGCPVADSFEGRLVEQIDCVSGAFRFTPAVNSDMAVDSVVVDRVSGTDAALPISTSGNYSVPGWDGPEEVKALVTFTDRSGTHTEHINHWCFGGPFGPDLGGDYKVCADDSVMLAYPREWVSAIDLDGSACSFFRYGPGSEATDHNVTLESMGQITIEEAKDALLPPGPWVIAREEPVNQNGFSDRIGTIAGGERIRFELAWDSAPTLTRRVVWLVDVEGIVWRLGANLQGLEEIDGMANSLQFLPRS